MSLRLFAVAAVLVLSTLSARAADPARSRAAALPIEETGGLDLRALFDRAPGVIETDDGGGVTVSAFAVEVLVARVGTDGKLIKACVDNEEAARKFLTAPVEKVAQEGQQQ
jgi:hypothetical protein